MREQLRNYEVQNGALSEEIEGKDEEIDMLEQQFAHRHEEIKALVETFIELENRQDRMTKETQHNLAMLRTETDKATDLNAKISNTGSIQSGRSGPSETGVVTWKGYGRRVGISRRATTD